MTKKSNIQKKKRISTTMPYWYSDDLALWAFVKGTTPTTLAGNVLQARIEANKSDVEKQLVNIAEENNLTFQELRDLILKKEIEN